MSSPISSFATHVARQANPALLSDTIDLPEPCRSIYVGGDGNLVVILAEDSGPVTFTGVKGGAVYPIAARRILLTGTTATNIVTLN